MRAFSRLYIWHSRLRALLRGWSSAIEPSQADIEAFALDRYSPGQQREIAKLIARQPIISRGDIADALERAERKARLSGQFASLATGVGFVAMFILGMLVARQQASPSIIAEQTGAASTTPFAAGQNAHWSPGGLDEADREFFADLQAGTSVTAGGPTQARPQPSPLPAPPKAPAAPVMAAAAQPPRPVTPRQETVIQLGAFADPAIAKARWQALSNQFAALHALTQTIAPIARDGRTLYRLQASGADAANACSALADTGATCVIIGPATPSIAQPATAAEAPTPSPPRPASASPETVIQLGAFADPAVARARWQALAMQFPALRPLTQTVSAVARGGRKLYRLRASGVDAASACTTLALAGATCFVATDAG